MDEKMSVLLSRGTWTLVPSSTATEVVACRWVCMMKYLPDGHVAKYKAQLVAKGFTQTYDIDFFDTFSPVARNSSIRVDFNKNRQMF